MTSVTTPTFATDDTWPLASAKAHFSEIVDRAIARGPQVITKNGKRAVVLVSDQEWQRKTRRVGSLVDFFAASPLRGADELVIERQREIPPEPTL